MSIYFKLLERILHGESDANIPFTQMSRVKGTLIKNAEEMIRCLRRRK